MVALVPFLDRGAATGRPRRVLNFFAAVTVAFVIFMTVRSLTDQAPAESTRQDPAGRCRRSRGNPRGRRLHEEATRSPDFRLVARLGGPSRIGPIRAPHRPDKSRQKTGGRSGKGPCWKMPNRRPAHRRVRIRCRGRGKEFQTGRKAGETAAPAAAIVRSSRFPTRTILVSSATRRPTAWDREGSDPVQVSYSLGCVEERRALAKGNSLPGLPRRQSDLQDTPRPTRPRADDFRAIKSPADIPDFCGRCHSNIDYMRHFNPSPRTDQLAEYWTSGHGKQLKATRRSESGHVYFLPRQAARQCRRSDAARHSSGERARLARLPHSTWPRPARSAIPTRRSWRGVYVPRASRFPATNMPSGARASTARPCWTRATSARRPATIATAITAPRRRKSDSVANACGTCHGKIAKLFADTKMRHKFETEGLPGCATCHSNHEIREPIGQFSGHAERRLLRPLPRAGKAEVRRHDRRRRGRQDHPCRSRTPQEGDRVGRGDAHPCRRTGDGGQRSRSSISARRSIPSRTPGP